MSHHHQVACQITGTMKFFLLMVLAKDRVRKIRDQKAIGSNYSFGPHLPLSFLLLFFLLTEIERGRVRKIAAKRRYEYEAFTRWSVPYYSVVFSFAFLFVDSRKR
jgi:hypothetical protein